MEAHGIENHLFHSCGVVSFAEKPLRSAKQLQNGKAANCAAFRVKAMWLVQMIPFAFLENVE